ncbi:hypothetical protein BN971_00444 [Mycobacterium bohemicum DSM 44277]|uniref:Uncharacterized protein n=1 Tax=Mycobacterium bohemicum DSM 44277 TaxID=1236609 RepID=A0A0U0W2C6_MYCBE|nr:hypothetical protein BN971_00444 [Mycobacterium bohemicum DSM 44277]
MIAVAAWAPPVRHPVGLQPIRDGPQQVGIHPRLPGGVRLGPRVVEQVIEPLAHHDVLPQRHRPVLVDHDGGVAAHGLDPAAELLGVADRGRQADQPHLVGQVQDHLLPHRAAHPVGEEVHLVHDDKRKSMQRRRIGVEHVAQHLGGHHHHGRVGVHRQVTGQQPDPLAAVARGQVGVLLVAQRLERRGVEALASGRQRQVHRELADHRFARAGGRADQHAVAPFQRRAGPPLEAVERERQLLGEPRQLDEFGRRVGRRRSRPPAR